MPARRDYTPDEALTELERRRRLKSDRQQRWRLRKKDVASTSETDVASTYREAASTPSPPAPPLPALSTTERLEERLASFANRAFKPDPAFLALLAERYPGVDLELELAAALDWLEEPRHSKRRCSKGFLANWVKKADADRKARELLPAPAPSNGATNGVYHPPITRQHNRRPDEPRLLEGDLVPVRRDEYRRFLAEARSLNPKERMARWTGGSK